VTFFADIAHRLYPKGRLKDEWQEAAEGLKVVSYRLPVFAKCEAVAYRFSGHW
jgi:hypothetical protein